MSFAPIPVRYPPPISPPNPLNAANIKYLVIHHTAGDIDQMPLDIDREERGPFAMMPYQLLCTVEGLVYVGRPLEYESAATEGLNDISVAACAIGNFQSNDAGYTGPPSTALISALVDAGIYLHRQFPSIEQTIGHLDAKKILQERTGVSDEEAARRWGTSCPGDTLYAQLPHIKQAIYSALANEK